MHPIFLPSQLAIKPFDYVALGHLHRFQNLNKKGYPAVVYSGSIERVDFGERKEEKGFCFVKIEDKTNFEFITLKTRPMIQIDIKLKAGKNQTEQVLEEIEKHDIKDAIVKIIYHVPEEKTDKVDLQQVQKACSDAMHLVSITPVRKLAIREKRANLNIDMDLDTLLEKYFETKSYPENKKINLLQKAKTLYIQINDNEKSLEKLISTRPIDIQNKTPLINT